MSRSENTALEAILVLVLLGLSVAHYCLAGLILSYLWGWYILPLGGPPITWIEGTGACLVLAVAMPTYGASLAQIHKVLVPRDLDRLYQSLEQVTAATLSLLFLWGFGAVLHWVVV